VDMTVTVDVKMPRVNGHTEYMLPASAQVVTITMG